MNIIEYMEKISGVKLLDYQKKLIQYIEENPNCRIVIGRGSTRSDNLMTTYFICKSILLNEKEGGIRMDINKIRDAMKVLKEECKKYAHCEECIFWDAKNDPSKCHLEKEPTRWEEDKIVENNCTTVTNTGGDEWYGPVLRCDNCDGDFMLGDFDREHIVEKFCPHCGKKIINYKEEKE